MNISIIIVCTQSIELLSQSLDSILSQTHDIEEIILCDKNMQCNDIGLIKSYKARISCLIYTNQGINETIKKTNGDYCLALFCGDCLAHDRVIEELILNGLDTDIIAGNSIIRNETTGFKRLILLPEIISASDILLNRFPIQNIIFKTSLIQKIQIEEHLDFTIATRLFLINALLNYKVAYRHIQISVTILRTHLEITETDFDELLENNEYWHQLKESVPLLFEDYHNLWILRKQESSETGVLLQKIKHTGYFKILRFVRRILLKYGFYNLKSRIKQIRYYYQIQKQDKAQKKSIRNHIYTLPENSLLKNNDQDDLIVSLSSYGHRVSNSAAYAICSIFTQTFLPNRIILNLNKEEWNDDNIPEILKRLKLSGLEICYCKDVGPHTKFLPTLKNYPANKIITVDDDKYYNSRMIEELLIEYEQSDKATIVCHNGRVVDIRNNKIQPYSQWLNCKFGNNFSLYSPYGVDGVLYPPHIFNEEIFNEEVFRKYCRYADDIWFWIFEYINHISIKRVRQSSTAYNQNVNNVEQYREKGSTALYFRNDINGDNDKQLAALINYYNIQ